MGKKGKVSKNDDKLGTMSRHIRREILEMTNVLLQKCAVPFGSGTNSEICDFTDVYAIVEKIRKKQQNYTIKHQNRKDMINNFCDWLAKNNINTDKFEIEEYSSQGYGLKAKENIKENDLILSIPTKLMMTTKTAKESLLGSIIKDDRIVQTMPNVLMALHVLFEYNSPNSFWSPYLRFLPSSYNTAVYFTPKHIQNLKGSPVASEVMHQFRNITRQYAYFYRMFQAYLENNKLPIKNFCFDDYRWAVSTVMTRQNQVPFKNEGSFEAQMDTALIPLWDMCNHDGGHITTDFNLEKETSECYSMKNLVAGEEIVIFYGPRTNCDFLVHNGFVQENNEYDKLAVKLGVSKNDSLYSLKVEVLARIPIIMNSSFYLNQNNPVDGNMLAFLRVFSMDIETLSSYLRGDDSDKRRSDLKDITKPVNKINELNAWKFLETRCNILIHAYGTLNKDDQLNNEKELQSDIINLEISKLLESEKKILLKTIDYCKDKIVSLNFLADEIRLDEEDKNPIVLDNLMSSNIPESKFDLIDFNNVNDNLKLKNLDFNTETIKASTNLTNEKNETLNNSNFQSTEYYGLDKLNNENFQDSKDINITHATTGINNTPCLDINSHGKFLLKNDLSLKNLVIEEHNLNENMQHENKIDTQIDKSLNDHTFAESELSSIEPC